MSTTPCDYEQIQLLRKLLDNTFESIEGILPEFHEKKNSLNFMRISLSHLEKMANNGQKEKIIAEISNLNKVLMECIQDLNVIYQKLNQNPAKLHGYKTTLKKFCDDCTKKYNIEVEFDNSCKNVDSLLFGRPGIYKLCTTAIETVCIQGHSNVYVFLDMDNGHTELKITGFGNKQTVGLNNEYVSKSLELLKGLVAWKLPTVNPETDWKNLIWFKF